MSFCPAKEQHLCYPEGVCEIPLKLFENVYVDTPVHKYQNNFFQVFPEKNRNQY